jgi:hypothetical protein
VATFWTLWENLKCITFLKKSLKTLFRYFPSISFFETFACVSEKKNKIGRVLELVARLLGQIVGKSLWQNRLI